MNIQKRMLFLLPCVSLICCLHCSDNCGQEHDENHDPNSINTYFHRRFVKKHIPILASTALEKKSHYPVQESFPYQKDQLPWPQTKHPSSDSLQSFEEWYQDCWSSQADIIPAGSSSFSFTNSSKSTR